MTSNGETTIRVAVPADGEHVAAIYGPVVRDTAISFEIDPPTAAEMSERIARTIPMYPWFVAERGGRIAGYAYSGQHRERAAYRWSVDVSVYISPEARRSGLGRSLYMRLFEILKDQGFRSAFAGITLPNDASVALHETMGFQPVGIYREVGFKFGQWWDVGWWRLGLFQSPGEPAEPIPFSALSFRVCQR